MQLTLFPPTGLERKHDIMKRLDITCEGWLKRARQTARTLCLLRGEVTIEDVTAAMVDDPAPHPNAKGAVFKGNEWTACGFRAAKHAEAHGRYIRSWTRK
jgi:hypothetical protein